MSVPACPFKDVLIADEDRVRWVRFSIKDTDEPDKTSVADSSPDHLVQ